MRKYTALFAAAVIAAVCTGCRSDTVSEVGAGSSADTAASTSAADTAAVPAETAETPSDKPSNSEQPAEASETEQAEDQLPKNGIDPRSLSSVWRNESGYLMFYSDDSGGCTSGFENGMGVPFRYDRNADGSVTFHMGAEDVLIGAVFSDNGDGTFTMSWEDGRNEIFTPIDANAEDFGFYTNEELQYIALAYYRSVSGYTPQYSGVQSNNDGTASIQLYDLVEDHNSTAAWYTIDRVTLRGTDDISAAPVDMTAFAEAAQQAYQ